ncbi:hypothetical protein SAMN04488564_101805 [Lentzea waywayandensis]|uniref:Uncharacterized protein n=1 Tax=Lentzea waywayandensis TaxID=84724 RepID=A0A1I6D1M1_9PSEU|nr:hypothetical protein SAMN04488564_101805 [Lentzea waywayandensis]
MAGVTVPPGLRPPPYEQPRGNFETIEVYAPVVQVTPPAEPSQEAEDRSDIAVIGPIAALVLALTISTLVLEHPAARAVATGLATIGLVVAVALMLMSKKPKPGKHVARHAIDLEATERINPGWSTPGRRR